MTEEILGMIPTMDIEELWNMYQMLIEEKYVPSKEHEMVKHGFDIIFDIRKYIKYLTGIQTNLKINYKNNDAYIEGKHHNLTEFEDEIDKRKTYMRMSLLQYYSEDEDVLKGRDKK